MSRIRIVSDLHLDGCMMGPRPDVGAEAALVAGDTVNGASVGRIPALLESIFPEKRILVIPGNHEGYRLPDFEEMVQSLAKACEGTRVVPLWRAAHELSDGVVVLGATLWTDFKLYGKRMRDDSMNAAAHCMLDYRVLGKGGKAITPDDSLAWHKEDREWIEAQAKARAGSRMVMMSHHGPRRESLAPRFAKDLASGGFISDLPTQVLQPFELWIHGHTHTGFDYRVGPCRVVCNPRGYTQNPEISDENPAFNPDFVVDL